MTKENEKLHPKDPLDFLPLGYRKLLREISFADNREEIPEILELIKKRAAKIGVSLDELGKNQFPQRFFVRPMPSQDPREDPSALPE